jgi:Holliday junction resolvase-like predicted endonuclease
VLDFEQIRQQLAKEEIENVLKKFSWKEFEEFISKIFEQNDFRIKRNFRFKTRSKHEIDLLAVRHSFVFCVDCKSWSAGRYKKSALRVAAKKQEARVRSLKRFLERNFIAKQILQISENSKFVPLIVTLLEEELIKEGKTFFVPVWKLNSFLLDFEKLL